MNKIKLMIDAQNFETVNDISDVHYRIIFDNDSRRAFAVCVQDFDYPDYEEFIGNICFANEKDSEYVAKKINKIGVKYFRN